jgi:hypothetical protein
MNLTYEEISTRFTYHPPSEAVKRNGLTQQERYEAIRHQGGELANNLIAFCPDSRELSLALTKLEEAVMWANAAIARRERESAVNKI